MSTATGYFNMGQFKTHLVHYAPSEEESNQSVYILNKSSGSANYSLTPTNHTHSDAIAPTWVFLGLVPICVWIIFGNTMVLLAVSCHRSLRSLSNYVIASLALTDLLLAALVTPLGVYQLVSGSFVCIPFYQHT